MLFAFAYAVVRLLLDVFDVRLRVGDPEAELPLRPTHDALSLEWSGVTTRHSFGAESGLRETSLGGDAGRPANSTDRDDRSLSWA